MKIAFATRDRIHINAHFGSARTITVYEVTAEGYTFVEALDFGKLEEDGNEDKLEPKIQALQGCTIVYLAAIGPSGAARIINSKITPIKARSEDDKIEDTLQHLVETLKGNPPPWLRKALQQQQGNSKSRNFEDEIEAEGALV